MIVMDETLILKSQQRVIPKTALVQMTNEKTLKYLRMNQQVLENVIDSKNVGDTCVFHCFEMGSRFLCCCR